MCSGKGQHALAQKAAVNIKFGGAKGLFSAFTHAKTRHVALSAPSGCAPQAAQGLAGAIFTLGVTPPTFPHPTLSAIAEPISRGNSPGSDIFSNSRDAN